jgi:hypothetical protein
MPSIAVQEAFVAISAATADGVLTVASNAYLFPGALAWLCLDTATETSARMRVKILACISTDTVHVRPFVNNNENAPPQYGLGDVSAFNGASHICQEAQTAPIDPAYSKRVVP